MKFYCPKCGVAFTAVGDDVRSDFGINRVYHWTRCKCGVHCDAIGEANNNSRFVDGALSSFDSKNEGVKYARLDEQ